MQEEYLHYLFKHNFFSNEFVTIKGEALEVIDRGNYHHNSGPDFLESKIKLGDKIWAGHIEFHVKSSDWYKHHHQSDDNYKNVIAHFVYEYDKPIFIGRFELPTIELKSLIKKSHYEHYLNFKSSKDWVPCEQQIQSIDDFIVFQQKEQALINRLLRKSNEIVDAIEKNKGDEQKVFWMTLAKVFGGQVNSEVFIELVDKFKASHFSYLNYDQTSIEAYCFGLAGFLKNDLMGDNYLDDLKQRFAYQKKLFNLSSLPVKVWKFSRMRPGNYPTVRLAQFAALLSKVEYNFKTFESTTLNDLEVSLNSYWQRHYHFGKPSGKENKGLSKRFKDLIRINVFSPILFAQGVIKDQSEFKENAIESFFLIPAEQNSIVKKWKMIGVSVKTAFDSQALIEQKNEFCVKSKCLECHIGQAILKSKK